MSNMSDRDRKLALAIIPIVLIVAYWFLLLAPARKDSTAAGTALTAAQEKRDTAESQARTLESAKSTFATDYASLVRLGKAVPTKVDMPSLIVQLQAAAKGTGISFSSVKMGERTAAAPPAAPAPAADSAGNSKGGDSSSGSSTTSTSATATPATGATPVGGATPVDAGGATAQTGPGKTVEKANNASATSDAANAKTDQASNAAGASGVDATTSNSNKTGGLPVGGGSTATSTAAAGAGTAPPGLDSVPLEFQFDGSFFDLADFFHKLKRFVHVNNKQMQVRGRLMTIDGLTFKAAEKGFPHLTAQVKSTVWLAPQSEGTTAGATTDGPAATPAGTQPAGAAGSSTASTSSTPTAAVTP